MPSEQFQKTVQLQDGEVTGRLDQVLAQYCTEVSRAKLQQWIKAGSVTVDDQAITKPNTKLQGTERIEVNAIIEEAGEWQPESIPLDLVFEDEHILVVNKPSGLVVHPAAGNHTGTLVNALLHHCEVLRQLPRAGIIHRLDKDTSGLLVIAKTMQAHTFLVEQLQNRAFEREYQCLVHGQMVSGGTVETEMGRHPTNRLQMAVVPTGKVAITHYRLIKKYQNFTHLKVNLETGRTHQIRVHMAHLRFPIVGDPLYGRRNYTPSGSSDLFKQQLRRFRRQALHARRLGLLHPMSKEMMQWQVDAPSDYQELLGAVEAEDVLANQ